MQPEETKRKVRKRLLPILTTLLIFYWIFRRVPFARFAHTLETADYTVFLLLMIPNSLFYFAWDTLVFVLLMRWFHGPIRYRDLLPVRAVAYVTSLVNSELAGGATAIYLTRQSGAPFFEIASTLIFLSGVELTHLALWATCGMLSFPARIPKELFWVPAAFALFWLFFLLYARLDFAPWRVITSWLTRSMPSVRGRLRLRRWAIFRTFDQAPLKRYAQVILLRAPMFAVTLVTHYFAVRAFGFRIPFLQMMAFLPIVFMLAALPITVARLGTTQAAWIYFFRDYAAPSQLLAFSLAAHLAFMLTRGLLGVAFLPRAYRDLFGSLHLAQLFTARQPAPLDSRNP